VQSKDAAEFFLDESSAQVLLVRRCLQYLLQPQFQSGYCEPASSKQQRYQEFPLFTYCADCWPLYLQLMDNHIQLETETRHLLLSVLRTWHTPRGGCFGAWFQRYLPTHVPDRGQKWAISTPLNIAAREGLNTIVKLILEVECTSDLEIPGGQLSPLLCIVLAPLGILTWSEHYSPQVRIYTKSMAVGFQVSAGRIGSAIRILCS
jgi:hypothetical protein